MAKKKTQPRDRKGKFIPLQSNLVSDDFRIPNHSGIASHPEAKKTFVEVAGDTMTGALILESTLTVQGESTFEDSVTIQAGVPTLTFDDTHPGHDKYKIIVDDDKLCFGAGSPLTDILCMDLADSSVTITSMTTPGFVKNDATGKLSGGNSIDISDDTNLIAGTSLTLTDDTLDVDDDFLKNDGDTGNGSYILNGTGVNSIFALTVNNTLFGEGVQINTADNTTNNGLQWKQGTDTLFNLFSGADNETRIDLHDGGNIIHRIRAGGETHWNFAEADIDFKISGDTQTNLFFVDASTDRIGMGTSDPQANLHISNSALASLHLGRTTNLNVGAAPAALSFRAQVSGGTNKEMSRVLGIMDDVTADAEGMALRFDTMDEGAIEEKMRISSTGKVGIGTASPSSHLHILESTTSASLDIASATDTKSSRLYLRGNQTGQDGILGSIIGFNQTDSIGAIYFNRDGADNAANITFSTQDTTGGVVEKMRINPNGKVGIGTTPATIFHIAEEIAGTSYLRFDNTQAAATTNYAALDLKTKSSTATRSAGTIRANLTDTTDATKTGAIHFGNFDNNVWSYDRMTILGSNVGIATTTPTQPLSVAEKGCMTAIGGFAIKLTNKTGANTIAGQIVKADTATNDAVVLAAAGDVESFGVFLDAGVSDGSEAWVVVSGIADVAFDDNVAAVRGDWVSTGVLAGYAATATSPAAAPTHFEEIGHCIESVAAGGAGTHITARCVLHFN